MSSKNKFLGNSLYVASSSVAVAGSLLSAAGVQADGNVVLERKLNDALLNNFWYVILNFLNIRGVFSEKIEKIKKEQLKRIDESEKKKKIDCINKVIEDVGLSYDLKDKVLEEAWNGSKENRDKKEMFRSQVKCVKSVGKSLYSVCYDDSTKTYALMKPVQNKLTEVCKFCETGSKFENAEEFYKKLVEVFFEDEYNKSEKDFCDFLDKESSIKEKKGLFEKTVFRGSLIYDFNFDCFIGENKLSYVLLNKKGQEIEDVCVVYNFGQKGSSGRYLAGENKLSKGEMVMYLEDIMEQAKKYKQGKKSKESVNSVDNIVNSNNS